MWKFYSKYTLTITVSINYHPTHIDRIEVSEPRTSTQKVDTLDKLLASSCISIATSSSVVSSQVDGHVFADWQWSMQQYLKLDISDPEGRLLGITSACLIPQLPRIKISLLGRAFPFFSRLCCPNSRLGPIEEGDKFTEGPHMGY